MSDRKPRVVLFRHAPVDFDSRAKRMAGTLLKGGFEPIIISVEPAGGKSEEFLLDGQIRVIRVPLAFRPKESLLKHVPADPGAPDPAVERVRALRRRRGVYAQRIKGADKSSAKAAAHYAKLTAQMAPFVAERIGRKVAHTVGGAVDTVTAPLRPDGKRRGLYDDLDLGATLPIADHTAYTLTDLLISLRPDILHAHHPNVLPAAWEALDALRSAGHPVRVSLDIRENFTGLPEKEIGDPVAHRTLLEVQRRFMPFADYVTSVNQQIADIVTEQYNLERPALELRNYPVLAEPQGPRTVREAAGLSDDTPLILYSGVMSRARGMDTLIEAMSHVPADAHLGIVTMPLPHPMEQELMEQAESLGVASRIHFLPAVDQSELIHYLSGADIAVHPMPGGSPNHDQAMPNKLFEYLHAGLTFVCSDAKLLAQFVTDNGMGRVFRSHDAVDLGRQLTAALAEPVSAKHLRELAERYSWQHNEAIILREFSRLAALRDADPRTGRAQIVPAEKPFRAPGSAAEPPHVVLFRHAPVDIDTRAKKIAQTLSRGGYRVTIVSVEQPGSAPGEAVMNDVRIIRVPLKNAPAAPPKPKSLPERLVAKLQRDAPARIRALMTPPSQRPEAIIDAHTSTLADLLVELKPDVLHVHHPYVFDAARVALRRLGPDVRMVYDARENWAGLPVVERGTRSRHDTLVHAEATGIVHADGVLTVAEPLADDLKARFHLPRRPLVALHYPVEYPLAGTRTVREALHLGDDVQLLVYSGVLSRARNLDLLINGLKELPEHVHLALVAVPYPHPQEAELRKVADAAGVAQSRLHFAPPVDQHELAYYLSGADVAVSAIPKGSPNHDLALPNKLFEYLHARLPLVHADAAAMRAFTRREGTGTVFRSGDVNDYLRAVRQNLETPVPAELLADKASERTWQHLEPAILGLYDRLTGFVHTEPAQEFPPMTVTEASG
ncbi:glycosyltransferase [Tessaracoccus massiliensis]|uniref:glycosyltransferase n=1 Tax=Tessaracoccus massiliensis TaxID=1522311 RepID=UPI00058E0AA9|nr:glycosyltransferase [Tessaracoccus massiliensis]